MIMAPDKTSYKYFLSQRNSLSFEFFKDPDATSFKFDWPILNYKFSALYSTSKEMLWLANSAVEMCFTDCESLTTFGARNSLNNNGNDKM